MSLRKLPEIKAFDELSGLSFEPDDAILSKWKPGVHAATEDDNTISIYDVIGQDFWTGEGVTSKRISAALRKIGKQDVVVNVNSPGGDFFEGIAIYNLLREHPASVTIKVMGLAASAASVIAMAGDRIEISEVGFLMVHNAWAIAIGNQHDFREAADRLEPFDDAMAGLYANRAGIEKAEAASWMNDETWFNGTQAIEVGLADALLSSEEVEEGANAHMKNIAEIRAAETAMRKGGMSSKQAKTLLARIKSGERDADPNTATRDAGDLSADLNRLIQTIKS